MIIKNNISNNETSNRQLCRYYEIAPFAPRTPNAAITRYHLHFNTWFTGRPVPPGQLTAIWPQLKIKKHGLKNKRFKCNWSPNCWLIKIKKKLLLNFKFSAVVSSFLDLCKTFQFILYYLFVGSSATNINTYICFVYNTFCTRWVHILYPQNSICLFIKQFISYNVNVMFTSCI